MDIWDTIDRIWLNVRKLDKVSEWFMTRANIYVQKFHMYTWVILPVVMYNMVRRPQLMVLLCLDGSGSLTRLKDTAIGCQHNKYIGVIKQESRLYQALSLTPSCILKGNKSLISNSPLYP